MNGRFKETLALTALVVGLETACGGPAQSFCEKMSKSEYQPYPSSLKNYQCFEGAGAVLIQVEPITDPSKASGQIDLWTDPVALNQQHPGLDFKAGIPEKATLLDIGVNLKLVTGNDLTIAATTAYVTPQQTQITQLLHGQVKDLTQPQHLILSLRDSQVTGATLNDNSLEVHPIPTSRTD